MATKVFLSPKPSATAWNLQTLLALGRRRRFLTVSVIAWVTIAITAVAVLIPAASSIVLVSQDIAVSEKAVAEKRALISSIEALNVSEIAGQTRVLEGALPREKPVLPLLYSLDQLAQAAQVSVSNFQITPGLLGTQSAVLETTQTENQLSPNIAALPLKMNVMGGFENLSTFFKSLDDVIPFIQVSDIRFSGSKAGDQVASRSGQYVAEVDLSSLYIKKDPSSELQQNIYPLSDIERKLLDKLSIAYAKRQSDESTQAVQTGTSSARTNLFSSQ